MNETGFKNKIVKILKDAHGRALKVDKIHGSMYSSGLADLIMSFNGDYIALELKVITLPKRDSSMVRLLKDLTQKQYQDLIDCWKSGGDANIAVLIDDTKDVAYIKIEDTNTLEWIQERYTFEKSEFLFELNRKYLYPRGKIQNFPTTILKRKLR